MAKKILELLVAIGGAVGMVLSVNNHNAADASRITTIHYQTTYRGQQYNKQALVYLPNMYDTRQRHNVVYLLHGSTESERDFFQDGHFKRVLDRLNNSGQLRNTIVVFPTYYPSRRFVTSDYHRDNRLNRAFAQTELVNDLIPAVEGHYHTYATGAGKTQLRASRNHRAFGGFSMGGITSWYVFEYQLPYFSTIIPMAGDSWTIEDDGGASVSRQTARRLAQSAQQHPNQAFKILAGVGGTDGTYGSMTPQINAMWKLPEFNHGNLQYYRVPDGTHSPQTIARIFKHYAGQIFN